MVVEFFFFFMIKSQPHRCYQVLSVVLIIIILLSSFNTFTSNDGNITTLSYTVETELKVTQSALVVHMGCTPFVKD